jgi:hypothetical protein
LPKSSTASAAPTYYVAHNCEFESSFFAAQGIELGPWICTYKCALRIWPELDGHSNQELRYALGRATPFPGFDRSSISPHRAAFDVVVTAAIFDELIKMARWSEMVQWSGEPALHTKFHFGKYRGRRYDEIAAIDPDYLRWIVEKSELEEGIKYSARYWLERRPSQPDQATLAACALDLPMASINSPGSKGRRDRFQKGLLAVLCQQLAPIELISSRQLRHSGNRYFVRHSASPQCLLYPLRLPLVGKDRHDDDCKPDVVGRRSCPTSHRTANAFGTHRLAP